MTEYDALREERAAIRKRLGATENESTMEALERRLGAPAGYLDGLIGQERNVASLITNRRLRDGAAAMAAPTDYARMTAAGLSDLRAVLFDGALALQSLDDLGSPEANDRACADAQELGQRLEAVERELARRGAEPTREGAGR